ncbi:RNase H family protein [Aeromonas caviae]|uniref:RNase H family protein n=1 Tax=Aeromonas caviae TaxID=648 RepID=UPI00385D525B
MIISIFTGNSVLNDHGFGISIAIQFVQNAPHKAVFTFSKNVSSQAADLIAANLAVNHFGEEVVVYSANEYVVNSMNIWIGRWLENDWKNKDDKQIKNRELIQSLYEGKQKLKSCEFVRATKFFAHNTDTIKRFSKQILDEILSGSRSCNEGIVYPFALAEEAEIIDI